MKSQVLSDFIAECNFQEKEEGEVSENSAKMMWTLFTDGSSTTSSGGGGIILTSPEDFKVQQAIRFKFAVTNNEVEYEALLAGLCLARHLNVSHIEISYNSQLVVKQILGEYKAINERMSKYMKEALHLLKTFDSWTISNIDRSVNQWIDALSKLVTSATPNHPDQIYLKELLHPSTEEDHVLAITSASDWRTSIIQFIKGTLIEPDELQRRRIAFKARNYYLVDDNLYRRELSEPLLRCVNEEETKVAIDEVHSGIYGEHMAGKNLALKIIKYGVFWPNRRKDCEDFVKKCKPCQMYGPMNHMASTSFNPITSHVRSSCGEWTL